MADQVIPVTEMSQTHTAFAVPMKELERLFKRGMLHHGANPILRWCMANPVVNVDHDGGLKREKREATNKSMRSSRLALALDGLIRRPLQTGSVYDPRGVLFV